MKRKEFHRRNFTVENVNVFHVSWLAYVQTVQASLIPDPAICWCLHQISFECAKFQGKGESLLTIDNSFSTYFVLQTDTYFIMKSSRKSHAT